MTNQDEQKPMGPGSVSIAMCTYNAERFVLEQLESFLRQTVLPSELVIQDDHSTDRTLEVVEAFSAKAPFPVLVERNPERLGPTGNFERSMGRCRGDIISLSDADDVWYPQRIETAAALMADRRVGCVFSDADLGNEDGSLRGMTLWGSIGFEPAEQDAFAAGDFTDALFRRTIGFGGTMTIRRAVVRAALPIPRPWGHDNWTAVIATALFDVRVLRRSLMMYRQHGTQYSGAGGRGLLHKVREAKKAKPARDWVPRGCSFDELAIRLGKLRDAAADPSRLDKVRTHAIAKAEHQQMREQLPEQLLRRVRPVLRDVLRSRYGRYSNGLLSALRDLAAGRY